MDPPMVTVSGPRSIVEKITRAEAVMDLSTLPSREGLVRTAVPFRLLDEEGEAIQSKLLEVTSQSVLVDSVVVEQYLYTTKSIALSEVGLVEGKVADGYEIKSISYTPEVVTAAARAINLDALDNLYANSSVDVTGQKETMQGQVRVRRPSELIYLSADSVTVTVEIGPVIQTRTFENLPVNLQGVGEGLKSNWTTKRGSVTIEGPQLWVDNLRSNHVTLLVNAAGLEEGTHELPVICLVQGPEDQLYSVEIRPETMTVTLTGK